MKERFKGFFSLANRVVPALPVAPKGLSLKGSVLYSGLNDFTFSQQSRRFAREVFSHATTRRPAVVNQIDDLYFVLDKLIAEKLAAAKAQNKKLVLLIGENHDDLGCLLIELIAMKVALKRGITNLGVELCDTRLAVTKERMNSVEAFKSYTCNLLQFVKVANDHPIKIIPIDPEGDKNKPAGSNQNEKNVAAWNVRREEAMARELTGINDHVLGVVGAAHLIPLCEKQLATITSHEVVSIRARSFEGVKNELVFASVFFPSGYTIPNLTPEAGMEAWIYTGLSENRFLALGFDPAAVKLIEYVLHHPYSEISENSVRFRQ